MRGGLQPARTPVEASGLEAALALLQDETAYKDKVGTLRRLRARATRSMKSLETSRADLVAERAAFEAERRTLAARVSDFAVESTAQKRSLSRRERALEQRAAALAAREADVRRDLDARLMAVNALEVAADERAETLAQREQELSLAQRQAAVLQAQTTSVIAAYQEQVALLRAAAV